MALFKREHPHLVATYEQNKINFPTTNPLLLIDLTKHTTSRRDLCGARRCCHCQDEAGGLIVTLINDMPAKFCSVECIKQQEIN